MYDWAWNGRQPIMVRYNSMFFIQGDEEEGKIKPTCNRWPVLVRGRGSQREVLCHRFYRDFPFGDLSLRLRNGILNSIHITAVNESRFG